MVNSRSNALLDALLPHYCALCGFRSLRSMALCVGCENDLKPNPSACYQCGIPVPPVPIVAGPQTDTSWGNHRRCGACMRDPPPFDRVVAPWLYDECMAHLIQRWKFHKQRALTPLLYNLWQRRHSDPIDAHMVVPVPLHWARRLRRGFNQAELFAQRIHADTVTRGKRVTLDRSLLRRNRATTAQTSINALERRNNLIDAFTVRKRCDNLRIALIDDVVTTGATVAAVANALKDAGAAEVHVYCLARTPSPGG